MPYLVRYAGDRSGLFKPITLIRLNSDLRMWMSPEEIDDAMLRINKGQKVRTCAATYYYTEEPIPTEEEIIERLEHARREAKRVMRKRAPPVGS